MSEGRKAKISITVPGDLLEAIDQDAAARRTSRSGVIESWLRRAARVQAMEALEAETEAYYLAMTPPERAESAAIGQGSSRAAKRLRIER